MGLISDIKKLTFDGEENKIVELVQKALDEGLTAEDILNKALIEGLRECGKSFEKGDKFIPEMLLSAEAMKASMDILKPHLLGGVGEGKSGKALLATVEGDVHDIGIDLVGTMLETADFSIIFLGGNVPTEEIIAAVKEEKPHLVGLSALLTTTMDVMPEVLEQLEKNGLRDSVKVMVGGAPVTQDFCDEIGADGWAHDATSAVPLAKKLRAQLPD